jgi:WD40 repeat protein
LWQAELFTQAVNCCAWLPDGGSFVCASSDANAYLLTPEKAPLLLWSSLAVNDIAFSPNGKLLFATGKDSCIHARKLNLDKRRW